MASSSPSALQVAIATGTSGGIGTAVADRLTEQDGRSALESYFFAFAEASAETREAMLRLCVAEDVAFSHPGVDGRGLHDLLAHIMSFQARFPGSHFRLNWQISQHGQVLAEWCQINPDGFEFLTAHSYARLNDEGRISHFAGFWRPFE